MKKILAFLSGATISHGLTALAGLLLARWFSVEHYAIYTVLMFLTGAMTVLTTGGVNIAFSTIVGRTWPDRQRAAQALQASLNERQLISVVVLPFFLGIATWLLYRAHAGAPTIAALLAILLVQWHFDMKLKIAGQLLLFAGRALGLQVVDTVLSFLRLVVTIALHFAGLLSVVLISVVGALGVALRAPFVQRWTRQELPAGPAPPAEDDRREIRSVTKRQLPIEVFLVFQAQIALFIMAWISTPTDIASFGALTRISQLFVPITMLVNAYAIPRFSQTRTGVLRALLGWSMLGLVPGLGLIAVAVVSPDLLLLLVGPHYASLQHEMLIGSFAFSLGMLANTVWALAANRGWNRWVMLQVPVFVLWCLAAPHFLDLSRLADIMWFQLGYPFALLTAACADIHAAHRRGELRA